MFNLFGCKTEKIIKYSHIPSKLFYEHYDASLKELDAFRNQGVLLVLDVKEFRHAQYVIWLEAYSDHPDRFITVEKAELQGASIQAGDIPISITTPANKNKLYKGSIKLFEATATELKRDPIDIRIDFKIKGDPNPYSVLFHIESETEKQTVFPT